MYTNDCDVNASPVITYMGNVYSPGCQCDVFGGVYFCVFFFSTYLG